jgi:hypothetical protein
MTKKEAILGVEANIMMAIFKTGLEHSNFLNEKYTKRQKQIFKNWQHIGYELFKPLEQDPATAEFLEALTNVIEDAVDLLRKEQYKIIEKQYDDTKV